jgi:type I restriction enzyme S subunit
VFPDHWQRRALYSLAQWVNGLAFRDIQFSPTGKPVIKIAEIKGGISGQTKFTEQVFDEPVHVRAGDLLFSWSGQPETSIDVFWWRGSDGWLNQHSFRVTPVEGVDPAFFFYLLRYLKPSFVGIARNKQTTGLGHVTKRDLENIEAAYPSLPEQRAIAHILGTLDDKVELNRRMNETLETMAQALFKSWFVDFDPVRAKAEGRDTGLPRHIADLFPDSFEDSELGKIPRGWGVGSLDSVLVLQRGFDLPATQRTSGAYPVLAASGPSGTHNEFMVRGPGVTTGRSGVLGKVFYVHDDFWPLNTSLWVKEFRHSRPAYAFHLLLGIDFALFNAGSAVPTLNRNHVHNLPTLRPPMGLIDEFERVSTESLDRQKLNDDQSRTLAALRDMLLPKLVSGELRVQDAERFIGERVA